MTATLQNRRMRKPITETPGDMREAIYTAFDNKGGVDYLMDQDDKEFNKLLGKTIPARIEEQVQAAVYIVDTGLPMDLQATYNQAAAKVGHDETREKLLHPTPASDELEWVQEADAESPVPVYADPPHREPMDPVIPEDDSPDWSFTVTRK